MSTRAALEVLLRGPWYHGTVPVGEAPHHVHTWATSLASGRLQPEAADLLKGYKAGLDITVFAFYKELMVLHPRAKVLLTVREARGWYRSMLTVRRVFLTLYQQPYRAVLRAMGIGHFATFTAFSWSVETPGIIGRMNSRA